MNQAPNPKPLYRSKTIWGLAIIALSLLAQRAGVEVTDAELQRLLELLAELGGLALALYGRWKAKQPLAMREPNLPADRG